MISFFEKMMFNPSWYHYILIVLLFPLSLVYGFIMLVRRLVSKKISFNIPIVSIGNLIVGGSGKTPFVIALALRYDGVTVISRGYGRKSSGLVEVSREGQILCSVEQSGDEAMLMAQSLPNCSIIVSQSREDAIDLAKKQGAKLIILDDGFNRVNIEKYEILLEPQIIKNYLPFPAGAFREFWFMKSYANIVAKEGRDFSREVTFENVTSKMLLVTAISNPQRLDKYLPNGIVKKIYLDDHAYFNEENLTKELKQSGASCILCTSKDRVKLEEFGFAISEMKLSLNINQDIFKNVDSYISKVKI
jgi:tetraacyldisaccharide 4'-kinase